jgi:pimeloyl-ACP methyl ester carboxylesterase
MPHTTSADGTRIAYDVAGSGPALILVDGAMCYRGMGTSADLLKELSPHFTVYAYDRRGRGESGDTEPYDVVREIEDIAALIAVAGGEASLLGLSSGAVLALDTANRLGVEKVTKVAVFECPFIVDDTRAPRPDTFIQDMDDLIAKDDRGGAVTSFMRTVGVPGFAVLLMKLMPSWKKLKAVAPTLRYDFRVLGDTGRGRPLPAERWAEAKMPVLCMDGGKSPDYLRNAMRALTDVVPSGEHRTLPGQTHMVKAPVIAPVVREFLRRG